MQQHWQSEAYDINLNFDGLVHSFSLSNMETGIKYARALKLDEIPDIHPMMFDPEFLKDAYDHKFSFPKIEETPEYAMIILNFVLNARSIPITIKLDKCPAIDISAMSERIMVLECRTQKQKSIIQKQEEEISSLTNRLDECGFEIRLLKAFLGHCLWAIVSFIPIWGMIYR